MSVEWNYKRRGIWEREAKGSHLPGAQPWNADKIPGFASHERHSRDLCLTYAKQEYHTGTVQIVTALFFI